MKALVYNSTPWRWAICKAAGVISKRAYYGAFSSLRLVDQAAPALPGPEWVRLRTILGGVCGTDLALILQRNHPATILQRFSSFPAVLGHENVATIDQLGTAVTGWKAGERVCVEPALGCAGRGISPPCPQCAAGRSSLCEHVGDNGLPPRALIGLNTITGGSWAEYFLAHQSQLHAVPAGVPDETAVLIDPIASAAHAVLRRAPNPSEKILVNGSGIIALGVIATIRTLGHKNDIASTARHPFQAELARRIGATTVLELPRGGSSAERFDRVARHTRGHRVAGRFGNQGLIGGFDLTYDCTGTARGVGDAIKWTRSRGTLVSVGTSGIMVLDTTPIWFDEIEIIGANGRQIETQDGRPLHTYELVFEWIRDGRLDLSVIPISRYALRDYRTALDHLVRRGTNPVVKAVFEPNRP